MCIQIYRRCLCSHKEAYGTPKRCDKAKKAGRSWLASLAGPKLDRSGYCSKKQSDSFGVPEPCMKCKAEGGYVIRQGASTIIEQREANMTGQTYYPSGGNSSHRAGGGMRGQAPLPPLPPLPPQAHMSSSHNNGRHVQVPLSRSNAETQQPQSSHGRPRRPTRFEDPRTPPRRPYNAELYAPMLNNNTNNTRKQSEKQVRQVIREAEKVSRDNRKKVTRGHSDSIDEIRARAITKAREEKRRPEPLNLRDDSNWARPAPLNIQKQHRSYNDASVPAGPSRSREPVYPDLRHHPAMKADVQRAVHHEAFTTRVHRDEEARRLQHDTVRRGAASHPDRFRRELPVPSREQKQYATRPQAGYSQPYSYATPLGRFRVDENGVSPLAESPPESEISAFNITQKIPYNYQRR